MRLATYIWKSSVLVGLPLAALAAVLSLKLLVPAKTGEAPAPEVDSEQAVPATSVRLARSQIVTAAGIEVEAVSSRSLARSIACNGSAAFNGNTFVRVPPKAAGILSAIHVDVGDEVQAGQKLAALNSQTLGDLKSELVKATIHEEHARWQIKRYEDAAEGVAAKNLFEARHMLEEDLADKGRIVARLTEYGFSPREIDEIGEGHERGLELTVYAPRGGTIVERDAVEGAAVDTHTPLFAIADLSTMWLQLYCHEGDLELVRLGQRVSFVPDGLPRHKFTGQVTWISPQIDSQTRTVAVRAKVDNANRLLKAHMFGRGELVNDEAAERLMVPQAAVQNVAGTTIVFVEGANNEFEARRIGIGAKQGAYWEVTDGLSPGERVATVGSFLLKSNLENPDFGKVE